MKDLEHGDDIYFYDMHCMNTYYGVVVDSKTNEHGKKMYLVQTEKWMDEADLYKVKEKDDVTD